MTVVLPLSIGMLNLGAPPATSPVDTNEKLTALSGLALWLLELRKTPPYWPVVLTMVALSADVITTVPVPKACSCPLAPANAPTPPNPMAATAATMSPIKTRFMHHSSSRLPSDAGLPILQPQVRSCASATLTSPPVGKPSTVQLSAWSVGPSGHRTS